MNNIDDIKNIKIQNQKLIDENKLLKKEIENFKNICKNNIIIYDTNTKSLKEENNTLINEIDNLQNKVNKKNDECAKEKQALKDEIEQLKELLGLMPDKKRKRIETYVC